ncbi:16S rRNA (cytidine(1402)-2'-O)-methyltransferase [Halothiobacillus sp. DCM-1]|uniref:16S rRNA (cytidine(1402)-2'-O)-methyltransferase n=1 Tax=Halothiobacillus sp. DCM-1 TaxID=3112558 RepID=UPI0032462A6E
MNDPQPTEGDFLPMDEYDEAIDHAPMTTRWVSPGVLYLVATPIGNRADFSQRAQAVLSGVDAIACEDTRHARPLLTHFGIHTPLWAVHQHNEAAQAQHIIAALQAGKAIAVISDAGTPGISDPGSRLVRAVAAAGLVVSPVPGASAVISALSASGFGDQPFWFEGFLPSKVAARRVRLQTLQSVAATLAFYEAPHRIGEMLQDACAILGAERPVVIGRELTKRFESIVHTTLADACAAIESGRIPARGEFVVLVAAESSSEPAREAVAVDRLLTVLHEEGVSARSMARVLVEVAGFRRNEAYARAQAVTGKAIPSPLAQD